MRGLSAGSVLRSVTSPRLSGRHWVKLKVKPGCLASRAVDIACEASKLKLTNWYCTSGSSEPGSTRAKRLASAPAQRPFRAHLRHLHRVGHGFVERVGRLGAEGEAHHEVVLEVAPHLRRLRHHGDAEALQRGAVAHPREHEQLRALDGAGREDHFAPGAVD